jgi:hypothetical protein
MVQLHCKLLPLHCIILYSLKMNLMHTRTNEVTLIARWDETENFGIAHLVKTELEKQKENAEITQS